MGSSLQTLFLNSFSLKFAPNDPINNNPALVQIESIKTTSMEDVSTRVLEKIKNI